MDRLFLDANVLFSAAYNQGSTLRKIWTFKAVSLLSSSYAVNEARVNLSAFSPERVGDLEHLIKKLRIVETISLDVLPPEVAGLPEKDRPILMAALEARATHLLTADKKHFGPLFGRTVGGVLILPPGDYIRSRL
ncbi:MAG: DNA-binding protein [Armatimonadetes bacterium]|nr:DNA-binding protein [Armatimonadota bacterium]